MADYGGVISPSQPQSSDDDDDVSSERSPRSDPSLSGNAGAAIVSSSKLKDSNSSAKKPRGRPPGSKNKPKPPVIITKDSESGMKPVVIEISAGSNVVDALVQFARKRSVSITVLSGSGSVSSVTLRHPSSHAPSLTLHGPFSLLSLSGSFLYPPSSSSSSPSSSSSSSSSNAACCNFGICLAGAQGQVFGGIVGGKIVAASLLVVVAAVFVNPSFHRLPNETEGEEEKTTSINGNEACPSSSPPMAMSVYGVASPLNCQIAPDAMHWGSNSRPSF